MKAIGRDGMVRPVVLQLTGGRINGPLAVVAGDELPVSVECLQPRQDGSRDHGSVCGRLVLRSQAQGVDDLAQCGGAADGAMTPA